MLVTHSIWPLPKCDMVISLKKGSTAEVGTYSKLMRCNGDFAEFINEFSKTTDDKEDPGNLTDWLPCS